VAECCVPGAMFAAGIPGNAKMNCHKLAAQIEQLHPEAEARDVARVCLLLTNLNENLAALDNEQALESAWQEMGLKLQAASDQHAAMTNELEELSRSDPKGFDPEQVWVLIRAIKVQSQVLQMYLGGPALDV
jgi:hypothetical protein